MWFADQGERVPRRAIISPHFRQPGGAADVLGPRCASHASSSSSLELREKISSKEFQNSLKHCKESVSQGPGRGGGEQSLLFITVGRGCLEEEPLAFPPPFFFTFYFSPFV